MKPEKMSFGEFVEQLYPGCGMPEWQRKIAEDMLNHKGQIVINPRRTGKIRLMNLVKEYLDAVGKAYKVKGGDEMNLKIYQVVVKCYNCGMEGRVEIPLGKTIPTKKCPVCRTKSLRRRIPM